MIKSKIIQEGTVTMPESEFRRIETSYYELLEACKDFVSWFDYVSEYQKANLITGQTLQSASENWENMTTPSPDITKMRQAIKNAEK